MSINNKIPKILINEDMCILKKMQLRYFVSNIRNKTNTIFHELYFNLNKQNNEFCINLSDKISKETYYNFIKDIEEIVNYTIQSMDIKSIMIVSDSLGIHTKVFLPIKK